MYKKLMTTVLILSSLGSAAFAADLPSRAAPAVFVPPPAFSWTGLYVGGQVGYEFGRDSVYAPGVFGAIAYNPTGVVGGAHAGYNYDFHPVMVGIEGDVNGSSYTGTIANPFSPIAGSTVGSRIPVDGSIRARVGFGLDRTLFYATGGAALASIRDTYASPAASTVVSKTRVGYTVGGGVDYAITNAWIAGVTYRYTNYGQFSDIPGTVVVPRIHNATDNRVQATISYKFDTPALEPIVARY